MLLLKAASNILHTESWHELPIETLMRLYAARLLHILIPSLMARLVNSRLHFTLHKR